MKRFLAILLIAASLCALLVPWASADTYDERVKAVVETALAFHFGEHMQYDSTDLTVYPRADGGIIREHDMVAPEAATPDHTVFTVCSSFCWEVYWNALGYKITDKHYEFITDTIYKNPPEGTVVIQHENKDGGVDEAVAEAKKLIQPGDICVVCVTGSGHAMLYVGDVDGDGKGDIIHSTGSKYEMSSGRDALEKGGNIVLQPADELVFSPTSGQGFANVLRWVIIRPLQAGAKDAAITPAARSRMKYSAMHIDRTVSTGFYGSAPTGDTLTYTLKISNHSAKDYTGLNVTETAPAGTELISGSVKGGGSASGSKIAWNGLTVPAGQDVTLSYDVKITAPRGTKIVSEGGTVDNIPSNQLITVVSGKPVDGEKFKGLTGITGKGTEFAENAYAKALNAGLTLPALRDIQKNVFDVEIMKGQRLYVLKDTVAPEYQTVRDMIVHRWLGGLHVHTATSNDRILEIRPQDLMPGDIVLASGMSANDSNTQALLYLGDGKVLISNGGKTTTGGEKELTALLKNDFFVCLRPSLAYDDVTTLVPEVKLPFTDVKEADWFYPFVKELYEAKVVSGMTDTTFVPGGKLTYGQALKLIVCGLGKGEQPAGTHWASGYLTFAKEQKWLDRDVDLNGEISRLAFCQIAAKAKGLTAQPAANPFTDCADKDVLALVNAGIINGMTATTFEPNTILTRAQISKIISGLIK